MIARSNVTTDSVYAGRYKFMEFLQWFLEFVEIILNFILEFCRILIGG